MTSMEKIELSIRRTAERLRAFSHDDADFRIADAFEMLANRITADEHERQKDQNRNE